jgi:hypothetical protein
VTDELLRILTGVALFLRDKGVNGDENWSAFLSFANFCYEEVRMSERRILEVFRVHRDTIRVYQASHPAKPTIRLPAIRAEEADLAFVPQSFDANGQIHDGADAPTSDNGIIQILDEEADRPDGNGDGGQTDTCHRLLDVEQEIEFIMRRNAELKETAANKNRLWDAADAEAWAIG